MINRNAFTKELTPETERALAGGAHEETCDFPCAQKAGIDSAEEAKVKEVAKEDTLVTLKAEMLKIDRWRESIQATAQLKP